MTATQTPPAPLEWHPAYRDHAWLLDWLEGCGEQPTHAIRFPIFKRIRLADFDRDPVIAEALPTRTLTKHKVRGLAPYVGDPFVYRWYFAVDELGRTIAGDAHIQYLDMAYPGFFLAGEAESRNGHAPVGP